MTTPGRIQLGLHAEEISAHTFRGGSLTQQVSIGKPSLVAHPMMQRPRDL
jgi:hypothetical protein